MTYTTDSTISHPLAIDTASVKTSASAASQKASLPSPPDSPTQADRDLEAARASANASPSYSPALAGAYQQAPFGEGNSRPGSVVADPLLLSSRLRSDEEMAQLRQRSGKGGKAKAKTLQRFYERQNEQIKDLLKPMDDHINEAKLDEESNSRAVKIAIYASLGCNCVLAILQVYAAVSSLSLSIFATAIDSVFDPLANFVLNYCHRLSSRADPHKWPSGGSRFETIGDCVYSGVMGAVSIILIAFSIQDLAKGDEDRKLHIPALVVVGIAFVVKSALFIYCTPIRNKDSQVRVLWEDHRNDIFINGFGLFTSAAGVKIAWWIDPAGAMAISAVLIFLWGQTCTTNFQLLAGIAAPEEFRQLVIYKAMTYSSEIVAIDSVSAYHAGPDLIVEVDIVMKPETPLWAAHDLSQALQDKLEEMPGVGRAFVHVDHEVSHKPEHRKYD